MELYLFMYLLMIGLYYELMESGVCSQCRKSLIPLGEESISTSEVIIMIHKFNKLENKFLF